MAIPEIVDVTVIGGGIFGLSAAWAFHRRGLSVRVLEAGRIGAGASGGIVGALSPHTPDRWNDKKAFQFAALTSAPDHWAGVEAAGGLHSGFGAVGRLIPLHSAEDRSRAEARQRDAQQNWQGLAEWRVVDRPAFLASDAHDKGVGAVQDTLSARLYPLAAVKALAAALRAKGVDVAEASPVQDASALRQNSRLVVVAAGYQSESVIPQLPKGLMRGVKGQALLLEADLPEAMPLVFDNGLYVINHPGRGVAIGSTSETEWEDAHGVDHEPLEALRRRAIALVPGLADAPVKARWAGVRPRGRFPDPVLGEIPEAPGVWLFSGGFKIGFGIAHLLAERLADAAMGQPALLPERFQLSQHLTQHRK